MSEKPKRCPECGWIDGHAQRCNKQPLMDRFIGIDPHELPTWRKDRKEPTP